VLALRLPSRRMSFPYFGSDMSPKRGSDEHRRLSDAKNSRARGASPLGFALRVVMSAPALTEQGTSVFRSALPAKQGEYPGSLLIYEPG
jgi:hypothetical protein